MMKMLGTDDDDEYKGVKLSAEDQLVFKDFGYNPYIRNEGEKERIIPAKEDSSDSGSNPDERSSNIPEDSREETSERDSEGTETDQKEGVDTSLTESELALGFKPMVKADSAKRNSLDLGEITEEKIDNRTGLAITSEDPMKAFTPKSKACKKGGSDSTAGSGGNNVNTISEE